MNINYAIEIDTESGATQIGAGLYSGFLRVITGNPDLTGATWGPNEIKTGNMADTYNKTLLVKDSLSHPSRMIDLSKSGNYGNMSSFSFKISNHILFWNTLNDASVNLINKKVSVFAVIDNVFYQIWAGNVTSTPRNEFTTVINCEDRSRGVHKLIPRDIENEKTVPISVGQSEFTQVVNVTSGSTLYDISEGTNKKVGSVNRIFVRNQDGRVSLEWYVDEFIDAFLTGSSSITQSGANYLKFAYGGDNQNGIQPEKLLQIKTTTPLFLRTLDFFETDGDFPVYAKKTAGGLYTYENLTEYDNLFTERGWNQGNIYVSVGRIDQTFALIGGEPIDNALYTYNESLGIYEKIPGQINDLGNNRYSVIIPNTDAEGSFEYYSPLDMTVTEVNNIHYETSAGQFTDPSNWNSGFKVQWFSTELGYLKDKDQTVYAETSVDSGPPFNFDATDTFFEFNCTLDSDIPDGTDKIYILPDYICQAYDSSNNPITAVSAFCDILISPILLDDTQLSWENEVDNGISFLFYDPLRHYALTATQLGLSGDGFATSGNYMVNFNIPNQYYDRLMDPGDSNNIPYPETLPNIYDFCSNFITTQKAFDTSGTASEGFLRDSMAVNDIVFQYLKRKITNKFKVYVRTHFEGTGSGDVYKVKYKFNQIACLFKNTQSISENLYIKANILSGTSDVGTNSVYGTFKYLLEDNDNLATSAINYGNLSAQRGAETLWLTARQITERKNSQTYLKELCQHSFAALYPDRKGNRTFNCWLDSLTSAADYTHNESNIVKGTLTKIDKLPIKDVFNEFIVDYNFDPAAEEFKNQMFITKTNEASFPAISGNWVSYAGGIDNYTDAKRLWENAKEGFSLTNTVVQNTTDLREMYWYGNSETALKYLDNLIRWTSVQHLLVDYAIPLTSANIGIELSDKIFFDDVLLTNNDVYDGYVSKITYDTKEHKIKLSVILNESLYTPTTVDYIVETGSADTDYVESGSQPNEIIEGT